MFRDLTAYRRCAERIQANWAPFQQKRKDRLAQQDRHGVAAERVAENILEDLFTELLDWPRTGINNQVGYADLVLTDLGVKYLVIEVKRPGALAWNRREVDKALAQVRRYADEQKVKRIAISDGVMLYAADVEHGGLRDRVFVSLEEIKPPESLWWLSLQGIYRPCEEADNAALHLLSETQPETPPGITFADDCILHPKYKLPVMCFAYVPKASNPSTWKLPYRKVDGSIDVKRLPKAIQAILSNYRGAKVSGIPEKDIPDILVRLACGAAQLGKMPGQCGEAAQIYQQLADVLDQMNRKAEVMGASQQGDPLHP